MSDFYKLKFSNQSKKDLKKLNPKDKSILKKYISDNLRETKNPFRFDLDMKKISGKENIYRYRVGKYRIIAEISKQELIILVININKRDDNTYIFKK